MAKQYYVKKDPNTNRAEIEWAALTGREFYRLITSPEGKGRFFIDMEEFMIEASKEEYIEWRREKDHSDYLREQEEGHPVLSIYSDSIAEARNGEEFIPDESVDVEADVLQVLEVGELQGAINMLDSVSRRLIRTLYFTGEHKTMRKISQEYDLPVMTLQNRKLRILRRLKKILSS